MCLNTLKDIQGNRGEIGQKNTDRYDHISKSVDPSHEGKVTVLWNQQCELTELFLTINRTS